MTMKVETFCEYQIKELDHLIVFSIRHDNGDRRIAMGMSEQTFGFDDEQREKVVNFLQQIAEEVNKAVANYSSPCSAASEPRKEQ